MLRLFPSGERHSQVLAILRSVKGPTQVRPHCVSCRLYVEDDADQAVLYIEEWDSRPHFEAHVRSELFRRTLAAMDLSSSSPELYFHETWTTRGLELVRLLFEPEGKDSSTAGSRRDMSKLPRETKKL